MIDDSDLIEFVRENPGCDRRTIARATGSDIFVVQKRTKALTDSGVLTASPGKSSGRNCNRCLVYEVVE